MKAWILAAAALLLARPGLAADKAAGPRQFEKLTSLLGYWEAKAEGKTVRLWYKLISGGSVLMETQKFEDEPEMATLYHLDGSELIATHYCSANNQPRLKAVPAGDDKEIRFEFKDVTNLAAPDASHMRSLRVSFADKDHFTQHWTWREKGKEETMPISYERQVMAPPAPTPAPAPAPASEPGR